MPNIITNILAQAMPTVTAAIPLESGDVWSFLGDAGWWQVILAVVALVVGSLFFWLQWNRKKLTYRIVSDTPFITVGELQELKGRLEITFDKQPIQNIDIRSIIIRVSNTGNSEIDDKDWRGPITFDFGRQAEVLTVAIIKPKKHMSLAQAVGTKIELAPVLLNKRQEITIKVLVKHAGTIVHDSAIKGVELTPQRIVIDPWPQLSLTANLLGFLAVVGVIDTFSGNFASFGIRVITIAGVLVLFVLYMLRTPNAERDD